MKKGKKSTLREFPKDPLIAKRELLNAYVVHNAVRLCVCVHCEQYRRILRTKGVLDE